jgi:hypothetical protein|mmetsp:Transcript_47824/g.107763  ORF Transcript_47824/g.107763 Transcript_47824/m.107763 type:complete len:154 (-) Transcript_47824:686-1147(-)
MRSLWFLLSYAASAFTKRVYAGPGFCTGGNATFRLRGGFTPCRGAPARRVIARVGRHPLSAAELEEDLGLLDDGSLPVPSDDGNDACVSMGGHPGIVCTSESCVSAPVYLCTDPPVDEPSIVCELQEGLLLNGKQVWACCDPSHGEKVDGAPK